MARRAIGATAALAAAAALGWGEAQEASMIDAPIPCARGVIWRVWAAPVPADRTGVRSAGSCASRAQSVTDATGIGNGLIPRPRAASSRPETGVLVASIISTSRPAGVERYRASPVVAAAKTRGWNTSVVTAATGEQVRIEISDSYAPEAVSAQAWADFFAGLVHGSELAQVTVRIAPPAQVAAECGEGALACYSGGLLVIPGESFGGVSPAELARHEYGHHVAANRPNPPWRSLDHGPKRWASQAQICPRAAAGTAFPDDPSHYELHPGEAFAESYRVLNERRAGIWGLTWSLVDGSFIPDDQALHAVEADVLHPWTAQSRRVLPGRFRPNGPRRRLVPLRTPLDGDLTAELRLPSGRLDTLELLDPAGRVLARGLWSGTSTRKLTFLVCGQRRLALRVTRVGKPGRFSLVYGAP